MEDNKKGLETPGIPFSHKMAEALVAFATPAYLGLVTKVRSPSLAVSRGATPVRRTPPSPWTDPPISRANFSSEIEISMPTAFRNSDYFFFESVSSGESALIFL